MEEPGRGSRPIRISRASKGCLPNYLKTLLLESRPYLLYAVVPVTSKKEGISIYISILSLGSAFFALIWVVCFSVKVLARLMGCRKNRAETQTAEFESAPGSTSLRQGLKSEKGWFVANNNNNNKWISVSFSIDAPIDEHGDCFKEILQKKKDYIWPQ
ncbi:uncharacterized protein LOC111301074 [Durio zibethinus]|uniref:Uncharacterized protein LOC111301074 n=1 Tax=Durio zibethinus TaxID=66656 RepID=A0A6P5ZHH1_DURZI|nr:uncharacterized protein LOC111301074 [Durio zibethinus]